MKPRNREVSIFNMSVLDLLTGALGAFCFLTLALFPAYFKVTNAAADNEVSAADAAKAKSAADALKALNIKLKSELADTSQKKSGMPPFAMGYISLLDSDNQTCGGYQIVDYEGPGGQAAIKILPTSFLHGYNSAADMFLLAPGDYTLTFNAYSTGGSDCHLAITNITAAGGTTTKVPVAGSTLQEYTAKFSVGANDLSFAEVFKQ